MAPLPGQDIAFNVEYRTGVAQGVGVPYQGLHLDKVGMDAEGLVVYREIQMTVVHQVQRPGILTFGNRGNHGVVPLLQCFAAHGDAVDIDVVNKNTAVFFGGGPGPVPFQAEPDSRTDDDERRKAKKQPAGGNLSSPAVVSPPGLPGSSELPAGRSGSCLGLGETVIAPIALFLKVH